MESNNLSSLIICAIFGSLEQLVTDPISNVTPLEFVKLLNKSILTTYKASYHMTYPSKREKPTESNISK